MERQNKMGTWKYGLIQVNGKICLAEVYWLNKGKNPSTFCLPTLSDIDTATHAMVCMDLESQYRYAKIFKYPEDFKTNKKLKKVTRK